MPSSTRTSPSFLRTSLEICAIARYAPTRRSLRLLPALERLLQVLDVARILEGVLEGQVPGLVALVQGLVHGLHAHFSRHLNDGVYLMGFIFADQRTNCGVRQHDLGGEDAALPVGL